MKKQVIRLTESQLNRMIVETVKKALKEHWDSIDDLKDTPKRSKFFDPDDDEEYDRLEDMTY